MTETTTHRMRFDGIALRRLTQSEHEPVIVLRQILADGTLGQVRLFDYRAKDHGKMLPGMIYEVDGAPDCSTLAVAGRRPAGFWPDRADVSALRLVHDASKAAIAARKRFASDDLNRLIEPLVEPYAKCRTFEAQTAFEAIVLRYLREARIKRRL